MTDNNNKKSNEKGDIIPVGAKHCLLINLPGETEVALEAFLKGISDSISPQDGKSCCEQIEYEIDLRKGSAREIKYIIYAGGHGLEHEASMGGITPDDFLPMSLPDSIQVYIFTCHQGKFVFEWARVHGLPPENIHGVNGKSYSTSTKDHLTEIMNQGIDPEVVWLKHMVHCYTGALLDKIKLPGGRTLRSFFLRSK